MNDFMINCWAAIEIGIKLKLEEIRTNTLYSHFKDLLRKLNARNSMVMTTDYCSRNLDIIINRKSIRDHECHETFVQHL